MKKHTFMVRNKMEMHFLAPSTFFAIVRSVSTHKVTISFRILTLLWPSFWLSASNEDTKFSASLIQVESLHMVLNFYAVQKPSCLCLSERGRDRQTEKQSFDLRETGPPKHNHDILGTINSSGVLSLVFSVRKSIFFPFITTQKHICCMRAKQLGFCCMSLDGKPVQLLNTVPIIPELWQKSAVFLSSLNHPLYWVLFIISRI